MSNTFARIFASVSIFLGLVLWAHSGAVSLAAPPADQAPSGPTRLLRYADISKDKVVFSYAGDLWTAAREGGAARRLTSGAGEKLYAKFSPDSKWIAFTAEY